MQNHWRGGNRQGDCLDREAKKTKVQTYFESPMAFFAVNHHLDQDPDQPSLFNLYVERFEEEMEAALRGQILPPRSENEVSPLLKGMLWHEHLEPFLIDSQAAPSEDGSPPPSEDVSPPPSEDGSPPPSEDGSPPPSKDGSLPDDDGPMYAREKVQSLRSVIALPRRLRERIPLRLVTFAYLSKVKCEFKLCDPRVKRMFTEYPST